MAALLGIDASTLPTAVNILVFVVAVVIIAKGAGLFVEGASGIGRRLGISELVLGLTVVAIGTSAPEFAVSVGAAIKGQGDIAVSNVVGSNIFNQGIILGMVAMMRSLPTGPTVTYRDGGVLLIGAIFAFLTIGLDLRLDRFEGAALVSGLVIYLLYLVHTGRRNRHLVPIEEVPAAAPTLGGDLWRFALGLGAVLVASSFMVDAATAVARDFGVSEWVIGVTIVAAGTSAPEMATSLAAAARGKAELGVGALIGSDIFNLFGVVGVAGLINPVAVAPAARLSLASFALMVMLVMLLMRLDWRISRRDGVILVFVALGRWVIDITTAGPG